MVFEADGKVNTKIDSAALPRILLISQWPNVKNGEYELIEKIKQTGFKIAVVDYFGFDVDTGECLNRATLARDFDFAVSFHYDTPKFLNIPTFLWVANPLEFMHLRGDYRTVLLHHLRANDDFLFNGSDTLKSQIRNAIGSEFRDSGLTMFPSCSQGAIMPPPALDEAKSDNGEKVFYCGVNWERGLDLSGRAQGLLDILQGMQVADFYGPEKLEGISPWEGFTSYKGEIPFDGVSMSRVMREYGAVLALSSPAHMRSRTSSSRVFEGIAAGVPVISDENAHVRNHFGDTVYYFRGTTEQERAASIVVALKSIRQDPAGARERVLKAQQLMIANYCFEPCFRQALRAVEGWRNGHGVEQTRQRSLDVFVFHHDPDPEAPGSGPHFHNLRHVVEAAGHAARVTGTAVHITCCRHPSIDAPDVGPLPPSVSWVDTQPADLTDLNWDKIRIGEKVALLATGAKSDFATFLTQFDFPNYDCFSKPIEWFGNGASIESGAVHIGGFFVNDLSLKAPLGTVGIVRNNASVGLYRWTQNSLAEHQFATMFFSKGAFKLLELDQTGQFDSLLPVSIAIAAARHNLVLYRSRHMLVRVHCGHFHRHYNVYRMAAAKGFWAQHYGMVSNYNHELNALYDINHESREAVAIADQVSGHSLPPRPPVDPAVHKVNEFIGRLRPAYHWAKRIRNAVRVKKLP